jgi:hypothetical protein
MLLKEASTVGGFDSESNDASAKYPSVLTQMQDCTSALLSLSCLVISLVNLAAINPD